MSDQPHEPGGCFVQPDRPRGRDSKPVFIVYVDWVEVGRFETAQEAEETLRQAVKDRGRIMEIG